MQANRSRIAPWVRWCRLDGTVFVLDLAANTFLALDAATSQAFVTAQEGGLIDARFEGEFGQRGWLDRLRDPATAGPVRRVIPRLPFAPAMALTAICLARRRLARDGFGAALHWALSQSADRMRFSDPVAAFRRAEAILPHAKGDLDCLPRATGLFAYLNATGRDPVLTIGVKRFPFLAHAWVELSGQPVLEAEAGATELSRFTPILRADRRCPGLFSSP